MPIFRSDNTSYRIVFIQCGLPSAPWHCCPPCFFFQLALNESSMFIPVVLNIHTVSFFFRLSASYRARLSFIGVVSIGSLVDRYRTDFRSISNAYASMCTCGIENRYRIDFFFCLSVSYRARLSIIACRIDQIFSSSISYGSSFDIQHLPILIS